MFRKIVIRITLLIALVALSLLLLFSGKGHTLLLDNKEMTIGGTEYQGLSSVTVIVDSLKPVTLGAGERDLVVVKGIYHTITIKADGKSVSRKFSLPFENMFLCSLPALAGGNEEWFSIKRLEKATPVPDVKEEVPTGGEVIPL